MYVTHTNSVYSENITLLDYIPYPQYVHQIGNGGGFTVEQGIKIMPGELVDYVLKGKHGASSGTYQFIQSLTQLNNYKIGLILAGGNNIWTGYLTTVSRTAQYPSYRVPVMGITQVYAGYIANQIGSFDYIATDSTSCISGHSAWYTARNMLALGVLDAVVVISVDNGLSEDYLTIFGENGLSKLLDEEDNPSITKFRLGQGCNISVFESLYSLLKTKHSALAEIKDMHIAAESHSSPLGISDTGEGYKKVINTVNTNDINFVKMHSTFSADNRIEEEIIKDKFGDIKLINYKLRIGHTMGAATAIETALAIQEESGKFLSLGAGMGNVFSSAVVEIL
jgi:3-oxoacyl-(acyl-carrier-protein) synthase